MGIQKLDRLRLSDIGVPGYHDMTNTKLHDRAGLKPVWRTRQAQRERRLITTSPGIRYAVHCSKSDRVTAFDATRVACCDTRCTISQHRAGGLTFIGVALPCLMDRVVEPLLNCFVCHGRQLIIVA